MSIRVLLADDQRMVRSGFRRILEAEPDIEVVAEAGDGIEALHLAQRERPDVSLLDIRMPGIGGLEVTRRLAGPGIADPLRVVVVTTFDLDEYVNEALHGGAVGFLLKDAGPAMLVEAVRAAARGDAMVSPQITVRLLEHFIRSSAVRSQAGADHGLTPREHDTVRAVALGMTNTEIAQSLYVSVGTVKKHLASVQIKLGVRNRVEIAAWAYRNSIAD
ncbi:DNA-binding response regulator [Sphaerisporangium siamense]|uniref:DNA-binding NarL/FixJ family response regulator n=1 Tax=Sphaerisporangium siamense TaxID=795645 RepID=A0A7W7DCQ1_9ACTN|nr:response regulator transcription factor [Sphaerisporangium siamense]MBB4704387.1 DNA-binding NarL/FixJ family response regulator [Sphaerisporangium siamense]GII84931.1 DNA-binding response regulator [Sphaerisporangium siamense]